MLEIETKKEGAELVSAKLDGIEKIHDGVNFWNRWNKAIYWWC